MKKYITDKEVAERYGVSVPTIWRWVKTIEGFPQPVKLTTGTTRWSLSDLDNWEKSQAKVA